jgi:hypothetical protein
MFGAGKHMEQDMSEDQVDQKARRAVLRAGLSMVAAGVAATSIAKAASAAPVTAGPVKVAQAKVAQNVVQYQTSPKDGAMCSLCVNFAPPNACNIVDGTISPNGWCVAFAPKSG